MASTDTKTETFFECHSWKVLLVSIIIFVLFAIGDIVQGMSADPSTANSITGTTWEELKVSNPAIASLIDLQVRSGGAQLLILALLSGFIFIPGYRRGERQCWYALWMWPMLMVFIFLIFGIADRQPNFPPPPPTISAPIFFIIFALALLLPYRKFFPKQS